jgi:hypothetical protein
MEFSKPKVLIDLDEYNDLKETERKHNESGLSDVAVIKSFQTALEKMINTEHKPNSTRVSNHVKREVIQEFVNHLLDGNIRVDFTHDYVKNFISVKITKK